jgi:hypothetical protein
MSQLRSRLRPLSDLALGLLLLTPVALFVGASLLKYAAGVSEPYEELGFLADPPQLSWYGRLSPFLFLGGPLAATLVSLSGIIELEIRRESGRVITTVTLTPRLLNVTVALLSIVLLAILAGYALAENLGQS